MSEEEILKLSRDFANLFSSVAVNDLNQSAINAHIDYRINDLQSKISYLLEQVSSNSVIVRSSEAFYEAIESGARDIILEQDIFVDKPIQTRTPLTIRSFNSSKVNYLSKSTEYLFDLRASFKIVGVSIVGEGNAYGRIFNIGGPRFKGSVTCRYSNFENVGNVIVLSGGSGAPLAPIFDIKYCNFDNIGSKDYRKIGNFGAIELNGNLHKFSISYNEFNNIWGNAIWVGNGSSYGGDISYNIINSCQRNAIENFYTNNVLITFNSITGGSGLFGGGGMGISSVGDNCKVCSNYIKDVYSYGLEIIKDNNNVFGNIIDGVTIDTTGIMGLGISIDNCKNSIFNLNVVKNIKYGKKTARLAVQLNNNCRNVKIKNSLFVDVTEGIRILSGEDCSIQNNDFEMTWDEGTLAGSCQPAVIIFSGTRNIVTNNISKLKKAGNINGSFYLSRGAKAFADFSGKSISGGTSGASLCNTEAKILQNCSNLALQIG